MSRHTKPFLKKIYAVFGIAFIIYSSYLVFHLVMHIWHKAPQQEAVSDAASAEQKLFDEMLKDKKNVEYDLGYKVIKEEDLENHFHHIGNTSEHDNYNMCIKCHGDIPHDKNKTIRAFLNMHSDFFACESCHIRLDDNKKYTWYSKENGKETEKTDISGYLSNIKEKLVPLKYDNGQYVRFDSEARHSFVNQFKDMLPELTPAKKSQGLKLIHQSVSKKPVQCDECHAQNRDEAYLPLADIGYQEKRIAQILSNEVVGMVNKYKRFYIPSFLAPEVQK